MQGDGQCGHVGDSIVRAAVRIPTQAVSFTPTPTTLVCLLIVDSAPSLSDKAKTRGSFCCRPAYVKDPTAVGKPVVLARFCKKKKKTFNPLKLGIG